MPNPRTIEDVVNWKPCPFPDGHIVTGDEWKNLIENSPHTKDLILAIRQSYDFKTPFKMPDDYYHLPPDKQLGLPLGEWAWKDLAPLIYSLPLGVIWQYMNNYEIATFTSIKGCEYMFSTVSGSWDWWVKKVLIKKQPPNLYNPLDHKEKVPVEPERVSVQEFLGNPDGNWVTYDGNTYSKFYQSYGNVENRIEHLEDIIHIVKTDYPIYATKPTAWLASKEEQEGKSE